MIKRDDINAYVSVFNSVSEFSQYIRTNKDTGVYSGQSEKVGYDFCKTANFEEADNLLLFGDKELQREIEESGVNRTRLRIKRMQSRRQVIPSVAGFAPHVPNYLAGVPTSMITARNKDVKQRVISICYDMVAPYYADADEIKKTAAAFIAACMMIEAGGVKLNIYAGRIIHNHKKGKKGAYNFAAIKIKDSGQQFDTLKMVYPLVHPSMLRRHFFKYQEVTNGLESFREMYGYLPSNRDEADEVIKQTLHCDVVLSYKRLRGSSMDDIIKLIEN